MKISIITICLNDKNGLIRTRESINKQKCKSYEHIIIDGGSEDGTLEYLNTIKDERVRWISEPDQGRSDAFNKGIKMAGDYLILCLNAGDVLIDDEVVGMVINDWHNNKAEVLCYPVQRASGMVIDVNEEHWKRGYNAHQGIFVHKKVYERLGGYNPYFENRMDYDFFYRLSMTNVRHVIYKKVVSLFDDNGISSYYRNNSKLEGVAIKLTYEKAAFLDECIDELIDVRNSISDKNIHGKHEAGGFENNNVQKNNLLLQWNYNTIDGKRISDYLKKFDIAQVSIYGCGDVGRLLAKDLEGKVQIREFIDRRADKLRMTGYSIVTIERMHIDIDAVIVTNLVGEEEICKGIEERYMGRILLIKQIVKEVQYSKSC